MMLLSGRYLVGDLVYGDSSVALHRGHDQLLERPVSIELLQPGVSDTAAATALREKARRMALAEAPHVAALYDQGDEEGSPYLVLEELLGEPLADVAPLDPGRVMAMLSAVVATLRFARERRTSAPRIDGASIRIVGDGRIQIIDWGTSQPRQDGDRLQMSALAAVLALALTGSTTGRAHHPVSGALMRVVQEGLSGQYASPEALEEALRGALRVAEDPTVVVPRGRPTVMLPERRPVAAGQSAHGDEASGRRPRISPWLLGLGLVLLVGLLAGSVALRRNREVAEEIPPETSNPAATTVASEAAASATSPAVERGTPYVVNTIRRTRLNVRDGPSQSAAIVGKLVYGTPVDVVEGPVEAEGYRWVRITSDSASGWCILEALQPR